MLERKYIVDILLGEFLGLSYTIELSEDPNYRLLFCGKEILIEDHFFNHYPKELSYLTLEALPKEVNFTDNQFTPESNIPILFGNEKIEFANNKVICGIDIFAASFFMLTRWEEYINPARDLHNRFTAKESLAYKFGFLKRPIVNEYVEMLWRILKHLGFSNVRKEREFEFILTHDIDHLRYYDGIKGLIIKLGGDLIKKKKISNLWMHLKEYNSIIKQIKKDPYDTFEWIMDLSERANIKSRFYFMSSDKTDPDNRYNIFSPLAKDIIKNIKQRGHIIGFHPSYNSYNNPVMWRKEKEALQKVTSTKIVEGRQHYLRFEAPITWSIWDDNKMERDLSLAYAEKEGFRCGVCFEYSIFNFLKRVKLNLKETPLIVMEASFIGYQSITPQQMYQKTKSLIEISKKYNGTFVYLWHNSSFNTPLWDKYQSVYESIISEYGNN